MDETSLHQSIFLCIRFKKQTERLAFSIDTDNTLPHLWLDTNTVDILNSNDTRIQAVRTGNMPS